MKSRKVKQIVSFGLTEEEYARFKEKVESLPRPWTKAAFVANAVVEKLDREKK